MVPNAVLITKPAVDFNTLLSLSQQALGYSPAHLADQSPFDLSDTERFLECLAAIHSEQATASDLPHLLSHAAVSVLVAADEEDMLDILQDSSGMPFVVAETQTRGVELAVITGTLLQWQAAVKSGASAVSSFGVRSYANRVMALFQAAGMDVWKDFGRRSRLDGTFLLEDKRK